MISDKVRPHHSERKALLYVRQSSAHRVLHNRASSALQSARRDRPMVLGWSEIEIIDDDLGRSAAGGVRRAGFERMVAKVCLGKVGAAAAREVSRFARNGRDWRQPIEMCRVVDTILIDRETIYAPRHGNDRLLLGLKGSRNEYALDLLRQRSLSAGYEKARRGELVVGAPVGFVKAGDRYEKDPDRRGREAIGLVFEKVLELGGARQALRWFHAQDLDLPVKGKDGQTAWRRRDLEAARYAADRAFRQYDAADPADRRVAGEPEARRNNALATLAGDLKTVWTAPATDARLKKRIVRTVIKEGVADIDPEAAEIVVHWIGGVHREMRLPRRRRGRRNSTAADAIAAVRQLMPIANDNVIAGIRNRNGLGTGHGSRRTGERVTAPRSHHRIPVHKPRWECALAQSRQGREAHAYHTSDRQRTPARSRPSIVCLTVPGSSPAPLSQHRRPGRSVSGRDRTQNTPRDRIPTSKASSLQSHRQMGVPMPGCSRGAMLRAPGALA